MSDILTPCQKICILDRASGLCRGCGRKAEEIAAWSGMSNSERARIMALLPERLAALGPAPAATVNAH
jgi:predicted Fe-S protein YdhL (DUF1289 family)